MRHTLRILGELERRMRRARRGKYSGPVLVVDAVGMAPDELERILTAREAEIAGYERRTGERCGPVIVLDA
jgi:hypothetical protein